MSISLIAAMTSDRVIGLNGDMPWHLPADLAWFKQNTLAKPIIMGRQTWDSIGAKALPGRKNIVISRNTTLTLPEGVVHATSPQDAVAAAGDAPEIMIIGGARIYTDFLPQAHRLYITLIDTQLEGDCWFPEYQHLGWHTVSVTERAADASNPYACTFMILDRLP